MAEDNKEVLETLSSVLSPEMASALGPPPSMNGHGGPPEPMFVPEKTKPLSPTQQKALVAEATSNKGFSTLAAKKFSQLAALMPGADRVRIRKRRPDGSIATIRDYNYRDVEQSGDIEAFVQSYLTPTYGGGDYEMALLDGAGKEAHAGIARFWGAAKDPDAPGGATASTVPNQDSGLMPLVLAMYQQTTKPQPVPDPIAQIRQTKELLMEMGPKTNGNSSESLLLGMMQMQQNAAAENQKLLMTLMAPKNDDRLVQMLERFDRRLEAIEKAPPPPPPPMMAPQGPSTAELITAIGGLAVGLIPLIKGDGIKATEMASLIIQAQQAAKPTDQLGVRDVISIFQDRDAKASPPATMEEQFGMLMRAKELAQAIAPAPQGPQGTTFWDALGMLFGNPNFAGALGNRVDAGLQPKQVVVTENRPTQNSPQIPSNVAQPEQAAPQVQLPANFPEKCKAIEAAGTPGERIAATVEALLTLRGIPQWQPFVQGLLETVAKGDKTAALQGLGGWFSRILIKGGLLSKEAAARTLESFDVGFDFVRAGVLEQIPGLRALVPVEAPQQAAAPNGAVVTPAPVEVVAPSVAAAAEGAEVPTGPAPVHVDIGDADAAAYSSQSL